MRNMICSVVILAFASIFASAQAGYDLVIRDARIVDGSGNPWYQGDVGIREGRIASIGRLASDGARRVLDAGGRIVAPGFIDVHTHAESGLRSGPTAENFLFDGVTSIVTGNCGGSETDLAKFFAALRQTGISINVSTLIGHNSVRRDVMGTEQRDPTAEELLKMEALVDKAMLEGAVGLSSGLIYVPGTYSKTPELIALARAAAKHNGVYASHMRNEGDQVLAAIAETVQIGREARLPVEISHFKISNKRHWGMSKRAIEAVEQARASGIDVTVDQYPYTRSSTNLGILLPTWTLAGGQAELAKRLADPTIRKKIVSEMKDDLRKRSGRKSLDYAVVAGCRWDPSLEGKSVSLINKEKGRKGRLEDEIQTVLEMMEKGGASMVYANMDDEDLERIMRFPYAMVASDAGITEFGRGVPHPRAYGTNARVLGLYVREKKILSLEEAIRKMTSLPAQRFRLMDRGLVRPGMWADLVVFDEKTVIDRASFEKPHAYAEGFQYVLVNGDVVIENGKHTGTRSGRVLLGPGVQQK